MESHLCSGECDSIHKHIVSKLLLTLKDGRPLFVGSFDEDKKEGGVRHLAEPEPSHQRPRRSLNKWFHLGIQEDDEIRTELRDVTMKWNNAYHLDVILRVGQEGGVLVRSLIDNRTEPVSKMEVLLERWSFAFEKSSPDSRVPELPELYKRAIVLMRSVYSTLRQTPANTMIKSLKRKRPYATCPVRLSVNIKAGKAEKMDWPPIPGTEQFEQTATIKFAPIITAHGTLKVEVEHRHQVEFSLDSSASSIASLKESFEELERVPAPQKPILSSRSSSFGSSPYSPKGSPRTKLGMGAHSPRRTFSQPAVSTSPAIISSPIASPNLRRTRTSSVLVGDVPVSSPATIGSFIYNPLTPSILGDSAISQFMKQCQNRPELMSLKTPYRDDMILIRRAERLRDQLNRDLEHWLSDFRAVEALSAPTPTMRSKPSSTESSMYNTGKLPTVSPVIECRKENYSEEPSTDEDYHLMFPL